MSEPGRITDAQVASFISAADDPGPLGVEEVRLGLAAAYVQRERERREDRAISTQHMGRAERIAESTRDLLDEIVSVELHPINHDPYPASVGEVADEIARYVLELDTSGAARGLVAEVVARLALRPNPTIPRECRQGEHRDGNVVATHRIAYVGPRGGAQQWTTDVCERHARIIRARMIRQGNRNVFIRPAGWTPQDD